MAIEAHIRAFHRSGAKNGGIAILSHSAGKIVGFPLVLSENRSRNFLLIRNSEVSKTSILKNFFG